MRIFWSGSREAVSLDESRVGGRQVVTCVARLSNDAAMLVSCEGVLQIMRGERGGGVMYYTILSEAFV